MASLVRRVQDLIIEDREVEGKSQADRVGRGQLRLRNLGSRLVCLQRLVGRILALVANGELCQVAVVVTLPVTTLDLHVGQRRGEGGGHLRTSCDRRP